MPSKSGSSRGHNGERHASPCNPGQQAFSSPVRVNSQTGSVIAIGTVRVAHLAVGKGGRVHVAWMGSRPAEPKAPGGAVPILYARLNDGQTAFEPQRNIIQSATGLDGSGSVAADAAGNVYIAWHAGQHEAGEAGRRVWMAHSADEGKTFSREAAASPEPTGACGCCGMRAFADRSGVFYALYRTASESVNRDTYLITLRDRGASFRGSRLHKWQINACPMSTAALAESRRGVLLAWETAGQVYFAETGPQGSSVSDPVAAPGPAGASIPPWRATTQARQFWSGPKVQAGRRAARSPGRSSIGSAVRPKRALR